MEINKLNLFGAYLAIFILLTCCLIFIFRLNNQQVAEYWTGIAFIIAAVPLIYLLYTASHFERPILYYVQLGVMLGFITVELFLDYIFKVDFRHTKWMAISYAMFFFAGTGGMIGIASLARKSWSFISIILFFMMGHLHLFNVLKQACK